MNIQDWIPLGLKLEHYRRTIHYRGTTVYLFLSILKIVKKFYEIKFLFLRLKSPEDYSVNKGHNWNHLLCVHRNLALVN